MIVEGLNDLTKPDSNRAMLIFPVHIPEGAEENPTTYVDEGGTAPLNEGQLIEEINRVI